MNNLVYLAGPITGLTYDGCNDWREKIVNQAAPYINTISPMRGKANLKQLSGGTPIMDSYDQFAMSSCKGINARDFNDVLRCDAVFCNFLGATKVSIGTVMELAWAKAFRKPVICIMEKGNIHEHCMLEDACGFIVDTIDEGLDILAKILGTDKQLLALSK